jgi:membrane protein
MISFVCCPVLAMTMAGLVLALWTTTSAASTLMSATTKAFDREDRRGFVRKRLLAFAIVVALGIGGALVLSLLVFGPHVEHWVGGATGVPTLFEWLWWTLQWPLLVAVILFAFAVALALGPDVEQRRWQLVTPGAVTALVVWLLASSAFAVYTSRFGSYDKSWGTISAVVVTLVWLWLTSAALLFGAEVNAEAQRAAERGGTVSPSAAPEALRSSGAPSPSRR